MFGSIAEHLRFVAELLNPAHAIFCQLNTGSNLCKRPIAIEATVLDHGEIIVDESMSSP